MGHYSPFKIIEMSFKWLLVIHIIYFASWIIMSKPHSRSGYTIVHCTCTLTQLHDCTSRFNLGNIFILSKIDCRQEQKHSG